MPQQDDRDDKEAGIWLLGQAEIWAAEF